MQFDKKLIRRIFWGLAVLLLLIWFLTDSQRVQTTWKTLSSLFSPFAAGAAIAFVFNVPMRGVEKRLTGIRKPGVRRGTALVLTLGLVVLIITGVVCLLVPQIQKTIDSLSVQIPPFAKRAGEVILAFLNRHPELKSLVQDDPELANVDWSSLLQKILSYFGNSARTIVDSAVSAIGSFTRALANVIISIFFGVYCLTRKEILARQGRRLLYASLSERTCDEIIRVLRLTNDTFSKFISGQCLEACILGCLFAITMAIFGMPYIPLVSVIIAVTALIPVVGAFVGCVVGTFFILVDSPIQAVTFVIMFLILQQLENNLIYPRVVGTSIGLPGMWVLVAVTVGGGLMGVGGMLLMIPLASVIYTLLGEWTSERLSKRNIAPDKLLDDLPAKDEPALSRPNRSLLNKIHLKIHKHSGK